MWFHCPAGYWAFISGGYEAVQGSRIAESVAGCVVEGDFDARVDGVGEVADSEKKTPELQPFSSL